MYTILKWNGEYGDKARFIVRNDKNKQQCLCDPVRPQDRAWVKSDLANQGEYAKWQTFGNEKVSDIDDILM